MPVAKDNRFEIEIRRGEIHFHGSEKKRRNHTKNANAIDSSGTHLVFFIMYKFVQKRNLLVKIIFRCSLVRDVGRQSHTVWD